LAGAPGLEPGPSVLETDMLAIDTMPLHTAFKRDRTDPIRIQNSQAMPFVLISLLYGEYVSGKIDSIFLSQYDPDHSFYFSWSNNFAAYNHHRLKK
jgi:hypothetical protein